jgi:hypothetical protein
MSRIKIDVDGLMKVESSHGFNASGKVPKPREERNRVQLMSASDVGSKYDTYNIERSE